MENILIVTPTISKDVCISYNFKIVRLAMFIARRLAQSRYTEFGVPIIFCRILLVRQRYLVSERSESFI